MKNSISIFSVLVLMSALITTSGCNLKAELDDLLGSIPKDIPGVETLNVTPNPDPLVENGELVTAIRGTGNTRIPGFTIVFTNLLVEKYVNLALVKVISNSTPDFRHLSSVKVSNLTHIIQKSTNPETFYDHWNVSFTPEEHIYYVYLWTTKEQYTEKPTVTSIDPTTIFTELTKDKTVLAIAASGSNKYYATGK